MSLKYYTRLKMWKASNNTFDGKYAFSYRWYCYARLIKRGEHAGKFIVTGQRYSTTTLRHIKDFIALVGAENVIFLDTKENLLNLTKVTNALIWEIEKLRKQKQKGRDSTNKKRDEKIERLMQQITLVEEQYEVSYAS